MQFDFFVSARPGRGQSVFDAIPCLRSGVILPQERRTWILREPGGNLILKLLSPFERIPQPGLYIAGSAEEGLVESDRLKIFWIRGPGEITDRKTLAVNALAKARAAKIGYAVYLAEKPAVVPASVVPVAPAFLAQEKSRRSAGFVPRSYR